MENDLEKTTTVFYLNKLKTTKKPWHLRCKYINELHEHKILNENYWKQLDTANLLGVSVNYISECLILARAIIESPMLKTYKSRRKALEFVRSVK